VQDIIYLYTFRRLFKVYLSDFRASKLIALFGQDRAAIVRRNNMYNSGMELQKFTSKI
jgi:hypothetical protein